MATAGPNLLTTRCSQLAKAFGAADLVLVKPRVPANMVYAPIFLIPALGLVFASLLAVLAFRAARLLPRLLFGAAAIVLCLPGVYVFLAFHQELVDVRIRTYKAFYADVRVGMTRAEVLSLLERDYPKGGPRQLPKIVEDATERLSFCMSPENERDPNCEGIYVTFKEDRVTKKEYVRD
jgi:hypothetical protein